MFPTAGTAVSAANAVYADGLKLLCAGRGEIYSGGDKKNVKPCVRRQRVRPARQFLCRFGLRLLTLFGRKIAKRRVDKPCGQCYNSDNAVMRITQRDRPIQRAGGWCEPVRSFLRNHLGAADPNGCALRRTSVGRTEPDRYSRAWLFGRSEWALSASRRVVPQDLRKWEDPVSLQKRRGRFFISG